MYQYPTFIDFRFAPLLEPDHAYPPYGGITLCLVYPHPGLELRPVLALDAQVRDLRNSDVVTILT